MRNRLCRWLVLRLDRVVPDSEGRVEERVARMSARTGAVAFFVGGLIGAAFVAWWPAGVALTVLVWIWCLCVVSGRSDRVFEERE